VPSFRALLREEGGDLPRFYARVAELTRLPKDQRDAMLAASGAASKAAADAIGHAVAGAPAQSR